MGAELGQYFREEGFGLLTPKLAPPLFSNNFQK